MALKVDIFARNMEVSDRINDYVEKKVSKLDRFLNDIEETRVDLAYVKSARSASDRHVAQITIRGRGYILRTEERADDIFAAIDATMEKLQRQIERYKGKRQRGRGDGTPASVVAPDIVRFRRFRRCKRRTRHRQAQRIFPCPYGRDGSYRTNDFTRS
jgi:putative sigma-54 modulation protein